MHGACEEHTRRTVGSCKREQFHERIARARLLGYQRKQATSVVQSERTTTYFFIVSKKRPSLFIISLVVTRSLAAVTDRRCFGWLCAPFCKARG